ncbi:MAG TPA: hypothetical protein VFC38_08290 [Stellaceae bacterium]|nr:hypothetical protein [Stellaceae bacterium]
MSSENEPVSKGNIRHAWVRHARALSARRWLIVLGLLIVAASTAWSIRAHRSPATPPSTLSAVTAETPRAPASADTMSELRLPQAGEDSLIIAPPIAAPQISLPPETSNKPPVASTTDAVPELPTVSVAPHAVHAVPADSATQAMGSVTVTDRRGRTLRVVPPAATGAAGPQPMTSQSPNYRASSAAPQREAAAPAYVPGPRATSPVAANPMVFSGRARVAGAFALDISGQKVRLFGVRLAEPQDRCGEGRLRACDAAAQAALQQRLAGHSIVACRVPPGQGGDIGAICLDEEGNDLGRYLVIQGLALADGAQSYDYLPAESAARSAKRGLWHYR